MCDELFIDTPSYSEFILMDREENDPDDVAEIIDICGEEEDSDA